MNTRRFLMKRILLAVTAFVMCAQAMHAEDVLLTDPDAAMAWLDTVGLPDMKGLPFARAQVGYLADSPPKPGFPNGRPTYSYGFVMRRGKGKVGIYMGGVQRFFPSDWPMSYWALRIWTTKDVPVDPSGAKPGGYETMDLQKTADSLLEDLRVHSPGYEPERIGEGDIFPAIAQRAAIFLFARACLQNGLPDQAHDLIAEASRIRQSRHSWPKHPAEPWRALLEREIGRTLNGNAILDLTTSNMPAKEVLAEFEGIARNYPGNANAAQTQQLITQIHEMITAEEAHAAANPLKHLTTDQKVAELIDQLREQKSTSSFGQATVCDPPAAGEKPQPAWELVTIGEKALPQLKLALKDSRPTRISVGYFPNLRVVTVGECVKMVADRIAYDAGSRKAALALKENDQ